MDIMVAIGSIEDSVNLYERLPLLDSGCEVDVDAIRALLADHARLKAAHADALKAMRQAVIALAHAQQNDPVYLRAYGVLDMAIGAAKAARS